MISGSKHKHGEANAPDGSVEAGRDEDHIGLEILGDRAQHFVEHLQELSVCAERAISLHAVTLIALTAHGARQRHVDSAALRVRVDRATNLVHIACGDQDHQ